MKRNATHRGRLTAALAATTPFFACLAPPAFAGATLEQPEVTVYRTAPLIDQPQDEVWDVLDYRDVTVQVKITEESISATKYAKINLQTSNTKSGQDWQTMETLTFTEGTDTAPVLYHKLLNVEHATAALGQYLRWQVEFEDASTGQWIAFRADLSGRNEPANYASHLHENDDEVLDGRAPGRSSGDDLGFEPTPEATAATGFPGSPHPELPYRDWVKIVETYTPVKEPEGDMEYQLFLPLDWESKKDLGTVLTVGGIGGYDTKKQQRFWNKYGQWLASNGFIVAYIEYRHGIQHRSWDVWTVYNELKNSTVYPVGKIGAIGSSFGNMVMNEIQINDELEYQPELAGYVDLYGVVVKRWRPLYLDRIDRYDAGTKWLFQTGSNDLALQMAEAMRDALLERRPDIPVEFRVYPNVGHGFFFKPFNSEAPAQVHQLRFWKRVFRKGVIYREHTTHY